MPFVKLIIIFFLFSFFGKMVYVKMHPFAKLIINFCFMQFLFTIVCLHLAMNPMLFHVDDFDRERFLSELDLNMSCFSASVCRTLFSPEGQLCSGTLVES